jgi:predicted amidophosphoribosyltransferase
MPRRAASGPAPGLLGLLLPSRCAGCGSLNRGPCCLRCRSALHPGLLERAVPLPGGDLLAVAAATVYAGVARRLLLAYKEQGRHEVLAQLADLQARAVLGAALGAGISPDRSIRLIPIPSRARNRRSRGADVGLVLVRATAARLRGLGWQVQVTPALRHRRSSADQAGLNRSQRAENVEDTLVAVSRPGEDRTVLLLADDILTTGATLREAARAMRRAGRPVRAAAVVATVPSPAAGHGAGHTAEDWPPVLTERRGLA